MDGMNTWVQFILSIISGLAVAIPLVLKLVEYVKKAVKEKNWNQLLKLVMTHMETAEHLFESGADKKTWVLEQMKTSSTVVNYDIDMQVVSDLIDSLCAMSKVVNAPTE